MTAKEIWDYLETTYGKPGVPAVYQDFRTPLALSVPADLNPVPNLDKFEVYFLRLGTNKFVVADHIKGMMLMVKLPSNMDPMIQLYIAGFKPATGKTAIEAITLAGIRQQVVLHWEQRQGRQGQSRASANKLSAVKRKGPDPSFRQQQQRPQGQQQQQQQQRPQGQQQQGRPRGQCVGRGRRQQQGSGRGAGSARPPAQAEERDILETSERIRTLENLVRQLPTSTGSSTTSSETLRETETVSSDVPSASISLSSPDTSRQPSPIRSGTATLRLGRTKAPSPLTTDGEDPLFSDEGEPVPPPKRKRTLKERLAPTLRECLDDLMDEADNAVSLGLTDAEEEINDLKGPVSQVLLVE
ncbi:hypothetical protein BD309DRAFT_1022876 [Dichomitus squalens]|nr:hypothetical protein BD309DRAFT_1022876 [Dichomitus squalens]